MTQRRRFTAEFKAQVVLDLLSGSKSVAELCRQYQLNPQVLARWKSELVERASIVFEQWPGYGYRRITTTDSSHPFPRYLHRVAQLEMVRPDQVWVSDVRHVGADEIPV